jgi:hypothetical protein
MLVMRVESISSSCISLTFQRQTPSFINYVDEVLGVTDRYSRQQRRASAFTCASLSASRRESPAILTFV